MKTRSLPVRDTIFGYFCDDNVCACAIGEVILLPVTNLLPEMDSATPISYKTEKQFACKPTFKGTYSKLVKKSDVKLRTCA